ncbi:MAG: hypothetical protein ABI877_00725 [Gemmatimonadaceae bacterium]
MLLASALFAVTPLMNAETGGPAQGAHLRLTTRFLLLAPLCDLLDSMSLLTVSQHVSVLVWLALLYPLYRARALGGRSVWRAHAVSVVTVMACALATYALGAFAPRPMARLELDDPSDLAVDFHSHSEASHDGRRGFGLENVRDWHGSAGFAVVYLTDHGQPSEVTAMPAGNPASVGDQVVVLPGAEFAQDGAHVLRLMAGERRFDDALIRQASRAGHHRPLGDADSRPMLVETPLLIETLPGNLARDRNGKDAVSAIELSDASPRGLEQSHRDRAAILHLADSLDLAVVASSNNHGWGRTAAAWSVMRIPDWRDALPAQLGAAIERRMRTKRRTAVRVVERRSPAPGGSLIATAFGGPAIAWGLLRGLSLPERLSWAAWLWMPFALGAARRRWSARLMSRATAAACHETAGLRVPSIGVQSGLLVQQE